MNRKRILAGVVGFLNLVLLALVLPVSAQTPPTNPPVQPLGLTGDVTYDVVSLRWDDPGDDSITSYQILRRDADTDAPGVFYVHVDDTGSAAAPTWTATSSRTPATSTASRRATRPG